MRKNPNMMDKVDKFLHSIGLVDKAGDELATLREFQSAHIYDLYLHVSPQKAANMVARHTGLKMKYLKKDGSQYWTFTVNSKGKFHFEKYKSGSTYMVIFQK